MIHYIGSFSKILKLKSPFFVVIHKQIITIHRAFFTLPTTELGVSAYEYFNDRVSKSFKMPSLAELIGAKKSSTFGCKENG